MVHTASKLHVLCVSLWLFAMLPYPQALQELTVRRFPHGETRWCTHTLTMKSAEKEWAYETRLDNGEWKLASQFSKQVVNGVAVISDLAGKQVVTHNLADLDVGAHTVDVRPVDKYGMPGPELSYSWTVLQPTLSLANGLPDRTQPNTEHWVEVQSQTSKYAFEFSIDHGPWKLGDTYLKGSPPAGRTPTAAPSSSEKARYQVKFTEGPRSERQRVMATKEGNHVLRMRPVDDCGNIGPEIEQRWRTAWVTTEVVQEPPSGIVNSVRAKFSVKADTPSYNFEYSLDGKEWTKGSERFLPAAQVGHAELAGLAEGDHELRIRAMDATGRRDFESKVFQWTVDHTPPKLTIREGFPQLNSPNSVVLEWDVEDASACYYEYQVAKGPWIRVDEAQVEVKDLAHGDQKVRVRAIDAAGNKQLIPASATVNIDIQAPTTMFAQAPERFSSEVEAKFWLTTSEKGADIALMYSLDGAPFLPTGSMLHLHNLDEGLHQLQVYCTDAAGNQEEPHTYQWTVDTIPPQTKIHAGWGTPESPRFSVSAQPGEGESREAFVYEFEWMVDNDGEWMPGQKVGRLGPGYELALEGLSPGVHTLHARSIDRAGNMDDTPALHQFVIPPPKLAVPLALPDEEEAEVPVITGVTGTVTHIDNGMPRANTSEKVKMKEQHGSVEAKEENSGFWSIGNKSFGRGPGRRGGLGWSRTTISEL